MSSFRPASAVALVTVFGLAAACSSSSAPPSTHGGKDATSDVVDSGRDAKRPDSTADTSTGGGGFDAHPDVILDPSDCVSTSATSSENGVGGYCSPGAGQCAHAGTGGTATICTADVGAPSHEWFCTLPCTTTAGCGPGGGTCLSAPFAQICVPTTCAGALGDASSSVVDAGDGAASHDAGTHDAGTHDGGRHDASDGAARVHDAEPDAHDASRG